MRFIENKLIEGFYVNGFKTRRGQKLVSNIGFEKDFSKLDTYIRNTYKVLKFSKTNDEDKPVIASWIIE